MKFRLNTTVIYKDEKHLLGSDVDVDEKDVEEFMNYGELLEPLKMEAVNEDVNDAPQNTSEAEISDEKVEGEEILADKVEEPTEDDIEPKKATKKTTTKRNTKK